MYFKQHFDKPIKIRDNPLQRSSSVSAIIHGGTDTKCNHYIDALQRFKRDHATVDREQREKKRNLKLKNYQERRNHNLQRQIIIKKNEQENLSRMLQKQYNSQMLHQHGLKKTAHTYSIPVNPINSKYEENQRGRYQAHMDEEKLLNRLVRAHHQNTCGSSGYNLINGRTSTHIDQMVPPNAQKAFQQKLSNYYSQFRIDPSQHPQRLN